jgi:hypothetical protein
VSDGQHDGVEAGALQSAWLRRFVRLSWRCTMPIIDSPSPRSPAELSRASGDGGSLFHGVIEALWTTANRHLGGTAVLLMNNQATAAGATMRGSLESSLWLEWLLAQKEPAERCGRAAALCYHDFTRGIAKADLGGWFNSDRFLEFVNSAGIPIERGKDGQPQFFAGQRRPRIAELLLDTSLPYKNFPGMPIQVVYSRLSGLAHGETWRYMMRLDPKDGTDRGDTDLITSLSCVTHSYAQVLDQVHRYLTGDRVVSQPWFRTIINEEPLAWLSSLAS